MKKSKEERICPAGHKQEELVEQTDPKGNTTGVLVGSVCGRIHYLKSKRDEIDRILADHVSPTRWVRIPGLVTTRGAPVSAATYTPGQPPSLPVIPFYFDKYHTWDRDSEAAVGSTPCDVPDVTCLCRPSASTGSDRFWPTSSRTTLHA